MSLLVRRTDMEFDKHTAKIIRNKLYDMLERDRVLREAWLSATTNEEQELVVIYAVFVDTWNEAYSRGFDEGQAEAQMEGC